MSTKDLSKWGQMYLSRVGDSYPAYCRQQYRPFLEAIRNAMESQGSGVVREEGCGIATITKILAQDANLEKFEFVAFDSNIDQVQSAEANCRALAAAVAIYRDDIFKPSFAVEVIHSHGVLEHFSDVQIHNILERQRNEAKVVIHYVPLIGWKHQSYGDERLLHIDHWREIHRPHPLANLQRWQRCRTGLAAVMPMQAGIGGRL